MIEFSTLSDIFGHSAWLILKETNEIEVFNVDADDRSCRILLSGTEYKVKRVNHHGWQVSTTGYLKALGSQWELLSWIGDRL